MASTIVAVRLPEDIYNKIEMARKQERRTKSNMVIVLLEQALAQRAKRPEQSPAPQGG